MARCYSYRPPYPGDIFAHLLSLTDARDRLLDLGSGNGKIAVPLANSFSEVIAVEPSRAMFEAGISRNPGKPGNLKWVEVCAEDFEDPGVFDLVTAGNSIHWFDHKKVFPKIAKWTEIIAVVSGDGPEVPPCGKTEWYQFISGWLSELVQRDPTKWSEFDPAGFSTEANRHENWIEIKGRKQFRYTFHQSVEDFIESQHSQATWSRQAMGQKLSKRFDSELMQIMLPHSDDGILKMEILSTVTWGKPRSAPGRMY